MSLQHQTGDEPDTSLLQDQQQQQSERADEPHHTHEPEHTHEQARWEDLESYIGSSDDEHHLRYHIHRSMNGRVLRWADMLHVSQSAVTESSTRTYEEESIDRTYDEEDVESWYGVVGAPRDDYCDRIQVLVFASFMMLVCFFGGVTIWILIT